MGWQDCMNKLIQSHIFNRLQFTKIQEKKNEVQFRCEMQTKLEIEK